MNLFLKQTKSERHLLFFLLGVDFVLILASFFQLQLSAFNPEGALSVAQDGGYGEIFQYFKFGVIALLLFLAAWIRKSASIAAWATVFIILLIDDAASIHENLGLILATIFSIPSLLNLRPRDFGEMIVFLLMGMISVGLLTWASLIDRTNIHQLTKTLLLFLAGFAVFGGIIDMLHIAIAQSIGLSPFGNVAFDTLEDGGEMVVISLTLGYIYKFFQLTKTQSKPPVA